jgi:hypothetical protein
MTTQEALEKLLSHRFCLIIKVTYCIGVDIGRYFFSASTVYQIGGDVPPRAYSSLSRQLASLVSSFQSRISSHLVLCELIATVVVVVGALALIAVLGHGLWLAAASLFGGGETRTLPRWADRRFCPRCQSALREPNVCGVCNWPQPPASIWWIQFGHWLTRPSGAAGLFEFVLLNVIVAAVGCIGSVIMERRWPAAVDELAPRRGVAAFHRVVTWLCIFGDVPADGGVAGGSSGRRLARATGILPLVCLRLML